MPVDPAAVEIDVPHTLLRFVEHGGYIYYMDVGIFEGLVPAELDFELPIIQANNLLAGTDGIRCGYRFSCPKRITKVSPNYLIVSSGTGAEWSPFIGLPGLQIYTSESGIALISTRLTSFLGSLEK